MSVTQPLVFVGELQKKQEASQFLCTKKKRIGASFCHYNITMQHICQHFFEKYLFSFLKNIYFLSFIQVLNDLICLFDLIKEANIINDCATKKRDRDRIKHIPICRWRMFGKLPVDPYCQKNDSYGCHILAQKHKQERKSLQIIMD